MTKDRLHTVFFLPVLRLLPLRRRRGLAATGAAVLAVVSLTAITVAGAGAARAQQLERLYHPGTEQFLLTPHDGPEYRDLLASGWWDAERVGSFPAAAGGNRVPFYRLRHPGTGDYLFTANAAERDAAQDLFGYILEGTMGEVSTVPGNQLKPLYRLFNRRTGRHFYTGSGREYYTLAYPWVREGIACYLGFAMPQFLYSLSHPGGLYVLTLSEAERDSLRANGWQLRPSPGYVWANEEDHYARRSGAENPPHPGAFYRLFDPIRGNHLYTLSEEERDFAERLGYILEGVTGYAYPASNNYYGANVPLYRARSNATGRHFFTNSLTEYEDLPGLGFAQEGIAAYLFPPF